MDLLNFDYSTKNIAKPSEKAYIKKIIGKTEDFCKRLRWKAFFYLNPEAKSKDLNTYGFKSTKTPPIIKELSIFEKKLADMIRSIKFRNYNNPLQKRLQSDIRDKINKTDKLIVSADKTTNFYAMDKTNYENMLENNITQTYRKTSNSISKDINNENTKIATNLNLEDRIYKTAEKEAYITLKDHKDNFCNNPKCRLINPSKSELGKISKKLLDEINTKVRSKTLLLQWKNTADVLKWYKNIDNKADQTFITFDVVDFYPSITAKLLSSALDFAALYTKITNEERNIILHTKKSVLFKAGNTWSKKTSENCFDVTMGSFDGAETCELIGTFLLYEITKKYGNKFGLYRDDGLGILNATPRRVELIKKDICQIFNQHSLKITIDANKKVVNFLDVTLDLNKGNYKPYMKPNNKIVYVHRDSNHPPNIIKNIPLSINKRLSEISSDEAAFKETVSPYQEALQKNGYDHKLTFEKSNNTERKTSKNRHKNVIWYNPPYSQTVNSNIGKIFLRMIDSIFTKDHILHKIFNRKTLKLSYSCMGNIQQAINSHNIKIRSQNNNNENAAGCNCRNRDQCPMPGECLSTSVIYQASVTTNDHSKPVESYVGLTENTFKTRFNNHKSSFNNNSKRNSTELSKYIWQLKDNNTNFEINWKILLRANSFNNITNICHLCLSEKYFIIYRPDMSTLNRRSELISTCRHSKKFLLKY